MVQIRYLKAKFTRESTFRSDLAYQKQYLLVLMARFERRCVRYFSCVFAGSKLVDRQRREDTGSNSSYRIPSPT